MSALRWLVVLALAAGCAPSGSATFTAWGEAYIEAGIPVDSPDEVGFVDGWTLRYQRFLVTVAEVTLAKHSGEQGATQGEARVVDLVQPGPTALFTFADAPASKWDAVSYAVKPAPADAVAAGNLAASDLERMKREGLSFFVEGTATKGATSKRFAWAFTLDTLYEDCANPDFGEGVTVPAGGDEVVQLTFHGDHLWYDDLQSAEGKLRFDAMAGADTDADGEVTLDELARVNLTTLPLGQYGTGSAPRVKTLKDYVLWLSRSVGHFRGEGSCHAHAR